MPSSIQLLHKLAPPHAIIHIGAGAGNGMVHQWQDWEIPYAVFIEANPEKLKWTEQSLLQNPGWHAVSSVLAESDGTIAFHQASNPEEDGIVSARLLNRLWPNLHEVNCELRQTHRLDNILEIHGLTDIKKSESTWAIIDCLPALPILIGAGAEIERWSVLWVRVLLKPLDIETTAIASFNSVNSLLASMGFRCIEVVEENQPALGKAIFVRDWHAVLSPRVAILQCENENWANINEQSGIRQKEMQIKLEAMQHEQAFLSSQLQEANELHQQVQIVQLETLARLDDLLEQKNKLIQEHEEQARLASEYQAQVEGLNHQNTTLINERNEQARLTSEYQAQVEGLNHQNTTLINERNEQARLANEYQAQVEGLNHQNTTLINERNEQARLASEYQVQVEGLNHQNTTLINERNEQARLASEYQAQVEGLNHQNTTLINERNEQARLASEYQAQVDGLNHEKAALLNERDNLNTLYDENTRKIEESRQELLSSVRTLAEQCSTEENTKNVALELNKTLETQILELADERDAALKSKSFMLIRLNDLEEEKNQVVVERDTSQQNLIELKAELDRIRQQNTSTENLHAQMEQANLSKLATDRQAKIEALDKEKAALTAARDEQTKLATDRQAKIEALNAEQAALTAARDEHKTSTENLRAQLEQANLSVTEKATRIECLESQLAEMDMRQRLINEEMIKAEAQIELIKDVLLREPGL